MSSIQLKDFTVSASFDLFEVEDALRRWGVAVLPRWLDGSDVVQLRKEWDAIHHKRNDDSNESVLSVGGDVADYAALYRSKSGAEEFEVVNKIFSCEKIERLVERVMGKPYLLNEEVYATYDLGADKEIASSHFDKTWNLKFMVYIEDILQTQHGAFSVHPGTQGLSRQEFRKWFDQYGVNNEVIVGTPAYYAMGNDNVPPNLSECVEILAPAGTLIIFSTDVYHRGGYLKLGATRRILRAHSHPGYLALGAGDKIRRGSRQWDRGEQWEKNGKKYRRFSKDGLLELKAYLTSPRRV